MKLIISFNYHLNSQITQSPKVLITASILRLQGLQSFNYHLNSQIFKTKQENKGKLAQYVLDTYGITLNVESMFDIQVRFKHKEMFFSYYLH